MAFSFGSAAPAANPFTGGLFGAPAASSASAFGASTAPAFGAASAPAFGASSAPAFGASSAPAFGATAAPAFGASPSPFGAPAAAASAPTTAFGTGGLFGQPTSAPATSNALVLAGGLFGQAQPQQQQQAATQARPGLNYKTKFEELPPQMQQELQKIQQQISSYRDECKALDNDARLYDTVGVKQGLDSETSALRQTLQSLYQAVVAEEEGLLAFRERVMLLLRSTETAIRLYQRSKLWRELSSQAPGPGGQPPAPQLLTQAVQDQMSQPVQLPNPFLEQAIRGFGAAIEQYHGCISELERVMQAAAVGYGTADEAAAVLNLPTLVSHMHDYFVHVAARMERLHAEVGRSREAYLAQQRARGDFSNPFAEARPLHHIPPGPGLPGAGGRGGAGFGGAANPYSFGGPAVGGGASSDFGGGAASVSTFGGGASTAPVAPAAGTALGAPGGAAAAAQSGGGGMFGALSPGPFGAPASPFGAPAAANPGGAFGTPLQFGAANPGAQQQQQQQQQRAVASRTGSSSSKKR